MSQPVDKSALIPLETIKKSLENISSIAQENQKVKPTYTAILAICRSSLALIAHMIRINANLNNLLSQKSASVRTGKETSDTSSEK